ILAFLVIVVCWKHLHIALAPLNVGAKRVPDGLGPLLPVTDAAGKPLDFATCTECGRCQSQCPAWNTGKPLSPKLVIMDLRDHLFAKAPYLLAQGGDGADGSGPGGSGPGGSGPGGSDPGGSGAAGPASGPSGAGGAAATGIDEGGPEAAEAGAAHGGVPESGFWRVPQPGAAQADRPLVGTAEEGGVIDPDVLWSCTTCGACVE